MSTYIIFDKTGKYTGYCDNDKWLKLFLRHRKRKFSIRRINKDGIHPKMEEELLNDWNKVTTLKLSDKTVALTCAEGVDFLKYIDDTTEIVRYNIDTVLNMLPSIKFSSSERCIVEECLSIIDRNIDTFNELGDDVDILDKFRLFKEFIEE